MKVSALVFLCLVGVTLAVPVDQHSSPDAQLTLADLEREQMDPIVVPDRFEDYDQEVARSKRFILYHKIALAKALKLGIGALGVGAAVLGTKAVLGNVIGLPTRRVFQPRLLTFPNGGFLTNQYFRR